MYIEFKYNVPDGLVRLMHSQIVNYSDNSIIGVMRPEDHSVLNTRALYLVCKITNLDVASNKNIFSNPLGVIARNESDAIALYYEATGIDSGTVLCEITDKCTNLKVEMV